MGLYPIPCPGCKKPFLWWSGNLSQHCQACVNAAIKKADKALVKEIEHGLKKRNMTELEKKANKTFWNKFTSFFE